MTHAFRSFLSLILLCAPLYGQSQKKILDGLREFYKRTAQKDGSFTPGVDPKYQGMSDCAYSDLAAVTYACTVHKTFGWELPYEEKTIEWLHSRQNKDGSFFNVAGTVDPKSPQGKVYNTTQALVALHALGAKPKHDPLPIFEEIAKGAHKTLPPYSTSFFPLAYLCAGKPIPTKVDQAIRATMIQDEDGFLNNHIAATYHASHYYQLVGEPTPKSRAMVTRTLREQMRDGSWFRNMPSRDRHATFDAVFVLKHEGGDDKLCKASIAAAAKWCLTCINKDGGFGHFPGSTSDADAIYFHIGTLIMAGHLKPVDPLPKNPHLLSWGHLMPVISPNIPKKRWQFDAPNVRAVELIREKEDAVVIGGNNLHLHALPSGEHLAKALQFDPVRSLAISPDLKWIATGNADNTVHVMDPRKPTRLIPLGKHRGAVMSLAFHPKQPTILMSGSIDSTMGIWDVKTRKLLGILKGHKSWVNAMVFSPDGKQLYSASSDGTVNVWDFEKRKVIKTIPVTKAEVRSLDASSDGKYLAAGIRYGKVKVWKTSDWSEHLSFQAHGGDVWALKFAPDAKSFATGNGDWNRPGLVKLWDVATGKLMRKLQHTGEVLCLSFSKKGDYLAAGGGDDSVLVWSLK